MPDVADSLREAIASLRANRLADAHALLERILAGDPGDAEALHLSGIVLYRRGVFDAAIARINKGDGTRAAQRRVSGEPWAMS